MMKWILRIVSLVVALVVAMTGIGWLLPVAHSATRSAVIAAPPAEVFAAIQDVERFAPLEIRIERSDAPTFMRTRITDPDGAFGGTWTYVLVPDAGGTRLTITEDGEVYNPLFRFLSRFVFSQTETMEQYLADLGRLQFSRP